MKPISSLRMLVASGCAALFVVGGCASTPAPTEQMAVSRSAITNAASAGGAEYAPVEMRARRKR
jgi:hypothetical protein